MPLASCPEISKTIKFYTDIYEHHLQYKDGDVVLAHHRQPLNQQKKRSNNTIVAATKKHKSLSCHGLYVTDKEQLLACWHTVYPMLPFPLSIEIQMEKNIDNNATTTTTTTGSE
jgi:hypothetical protein